MKYMELAIRINEIIQDLDTEKLKFFYRELRKGLEEIL